MSGVFISHASADKVLVNPFVDYIIRLGCQVAPDSIFYSSGEDTGIPSGSDLNEYVRSEIGSVSLVVAVISPTFQTRPFCVAELGAAWSRVNRLFPIATPGFERTAMEGVLAGLVVKHLSDSAALDELHDVVCSTLRTSPTAATWGRYKATWLAQVDNLMQKIPIPRIISQEDYDRVLNDLEGAREALRAAEATMQEQSHQIERLASAASPQDVAEILLPKDDREAFKALVQRAELALSELPQVVREAIWFKFTEDGMPWPNIFEGERAAVEEAYRDGWLRDSDGEGLWPNAEFDEVSLASDAVDQLDEFLRMRKYDERFEQWFRREYHLPPDIHLRRVWDKLL